MRLITKIGFVSLLLALSSMLFSCVDEPTITPVSVPYTSLRVGNFSSNVSPMTITIDGKNVGTITADQITSRFDVTSGSRNFVITDGAGNKVYDKSVSVGSFEEETLLFAGYSSDIDTVNSFGVSPLTEGVVYLKEAPPADTSWFNLINMVTDASIDIAGKDIFYSVTPADTSISKETLEGFVKFGANEKVGSAFASQKYYYTFKDSTSADTTGSTPGMAIKDSLQLVSGMRYYLFISGTRSSFHVVVDEEAPLPIRSK